MSEKSEKVKDWRKSSAYAALKDEIYSSLGGKYGMDAITKSRVEEYLDYWVLRHQLQDDISKRGLYTQDDRGRMMENRSVSLSIQASRQMASIAGSLGLIVGADRQMDEEDL